MSPFKKAAVKGGSPKGKEPVIDVDDYSLKTKRTHSPSGVFDPNKFRSYAAFQTHENYFRTATPLLERPVDQSSLHDTDIPKWFAHKDCVRLNLINHLVGFIPYQIYLYFSI